MELDDYDIMLLFVILRNLEFASLPTIQEAMFGFASEDHEKIKELKSKLEEMIG